MSQERKKRSLPLIIANATVMAVMVALCVIMIMVVVGSILGSHNPVGAAILVLGAALILWSCVYLGTN